MCLAYLRHFGGRAQAVVQHDRFRRILTKQASQDLFELLQRPGDRFRRSLAAGFLKRLRHFDCKGQGRQYLNVGHTGLNSATFRQWVDQADVRPIYLVHDLIPITHPQFCRVGEAEKHRERMRTVLLTAAGVIGNSQATLFELGNFARAEGLSMPSAISAWLGSDPLPLPANSPASHPPQFVILGTIEARKNHQLLLNIWIELIERFGRETPKLVIIGQRGWEARPVFDLLDHNEKLREHVVELNSCPDEQLADYLSSARALLFPSIIEGYGLPLIEALASGVPAIASDLPVFREICGDIPTYLGPFDASGWRGAILDYARSDSSLRNAQLRRMNAFRATNWDAHFHSVEAWLSTLG